ncbi:MAG: murein biosynthesis integral membrane protein MurJ, partial [Candidatus Omnitrophica bacterium]|nr:murein biosynthesis integral membrane protein MurJ [Candidatus Omnitrophota bacterium]
MSTNKSIAKSAGVIGAFTLLSRILGFVRDIVIAGFFGTALYAQAFVVAFRIPNLLRDLVGEGAVNAAFVPVLTETITKKGKAEFFKLAQVLLNILVVALIVLTLAGVILSPLLVKLIAPGFMADKEKFDMTVMLTRVLFPFLLLVGFWAYAMAVLNSLGHFAAPSLGPCVLNLSMILCASWFGENILGLAAGVLAGGLLQFLIQIPPLYLKGWRARLTPEFRHPEAKKIGILLIPRAAGACMYQVNVFVSTILASLSNIVGEGAVAALYYANRIWQLPLAIFGIAIAQAALPAMSRHAAQNDTEKLKHTLLFSMRALFFILVPSSIGLMVLSEPITRLLFQRGAFTAYSTRITADALFFYAVGLIACGGIKVLVSAFYSLQDTKTPLKAGAAALVVNVLLNLMLMGPLKAGGLALANSLASILNCAVLYIALRNKIGQLGISTVWDSLVKILAAGLVMLVACNFVLVKTNVIAAIPAGIIAYLLTCFLLKSSELKEILSWVLRK